MIKDNKGKERWHFQIYSIEEKLDTVKWEKRQNTSGWPVHAIKELKIPNRWRGTLLPDSFIAS